jgi:hypothetical protein
MRPPYRLTAGLVLCGEKPRSVLTVWVGYSTHSSAGFRFAFTSMGEGWRSCANAGASAAVLKN